MLGQRERFEDWLDMGSGLVRRGLRAPMLVVTDGVPGLIRAMEELWPYNDSQRRTVHRLRNLVAKLPKKDAELRNRIEAASPADGEARLRRLVTELERQYPSAAACLPRICRHSACTSRTRCAFASASARPTSWSGRWRK